MIQIFYQPLFIRFAGGELKFCIDLFLIHPVYSDPDHGPVLDFGSTVEFGSALDTDPKSVVPVRTYFDEADSASGGGDTSQEDHSADYALDIVNELSGPAALVPGSKRHDRQLPIRERDGA
ncbi:hypothetical protein EVAR_64290_1 [Eumeta japonica]|uniref:Uncharacterized protein n=1 Tax=Eumeta variegata TaxID=151549 RepID=A0A4C2A3N2_EUMVA|nr:hypothetical protein EVAR_64290_1 [Eumeta japonica]